MHMNYKINHKLSDLEAAYLMLILLASSQKKVPETLDFLFPTLLLLQKTGSWSARITHYFFFSC